jgi:hypothetical protein
MEIPQRSITQKDNQFARKITWQQKKQPYYTWVISPSVRSRIVLDHPHQGYYHQLDCPPRQGDPIQPEKRLQKTPPLSMWAQFCSGWFGFLKMDLRLKQTFNGLITAWGITAQSGEI